MLVEAKSDSTLALSAENVQLDAKDRVVSWPTLESIAANLLVVDLTRGADQNPSQISAGSKPGELIVNHPVAGLIANLGPLADDASLQTDPDGRLRLVTPSDQLYDLVFASPINLFGVQGLGGADRLQVESVDFGGASFSVDVESIALAAGKTLRTTGDVVLRAIDAASAATASLQSASARIAIDGAIAAGGDLMLRAQAGALIEFTAAASDTALSASAAITAEAVVGSQASLQARSIAVLADTTLDIAAQSSPAGALALSMAVTQTSKASVAGGARLTTTGTSSGTQGGVLIEATGGHSIRSSSAPVVSSNTGATDLSITVKLTRIATASLGDDLGRVSVGPATASDSAPAIQVSALARDTASGGLSGLVSDPRTGRWVVDVNGAVNASITRADLSAGALRLFALDATTTSGSARQTARPNQVRMRALSLALSLARSLARNRAPNLEPNLEPNLASIRDSIFVLTIGQNLVPRPDRLPPAQHVLIQTFSHLTPNHRPADPTPGTHPNAPTNRHATAPSDHCPSFR